MAYIYKIWNDVNDKIYVGKTNRTLKKRFYEHCRDSKFSSKNNRPLYRAMNKYGVEHFYIEKLEETTREQASERECYWIKYFNSFRNGYNATMGGDGKPWVDEKEILNLYADGKSKADIVRETGHDLSTVNSILIDHYTKKELSARSLVARSVNYRPVAQIDLISNQIISIYESVAEAKRSLGRNLRIDRVCNGVTHQAGGYGWVYVNNGIVDTSNFKHSKSRPSFNADKRR